MNQLAISAMTDQLRLTSLLDAIENSSSMVILTHNDPDPDAIASACALRYLVTSLMGVTPVIAYGGIVGRAENRAMVSYLDLDMKIAGELEWAEFETVALVDSQPGAGNNSLPSTRVADIVFDHHRPFREQTSLAQHADVRLCMGASSTILVGYVLAAGLEICPALATALFYGIQTDTMGLSRDTGDADRAMYALLQPLVDTEGLIMIERAQVPREYFQAFAEALEDAQVYDGRVVVAHLGEMYRPDMAAEVADVLMRLKGAEWILCSGFYRDRLMLSLRSTLQDLEAGMIAQTIVEGIGEAGGHGSVGGGQVMLFGQDRDALIRKVDSRFFAALGCNSGSRERLVPDQTG